MRPSSGDALKRVHHAPERSLPDALKGLGGSDRPDGQGAPSADEEQEHEKLVGAAMAEHAAR